jgi:transcriptional regulator with XRE-family HTH domain
MPDIRKQFGEAVRRLRQERGYSQEGFAADAGINRSYMGKIERGEVNISLDNIARIAKGLAVPISELMSGLRA